MRLHPGFVAAVLAGIEETLDELIELSSDSSDTRADLERLQADVAGLRASLEANADAWEAEDAETGPSRLPETEQENMQ